MADQRRFGNHGPESPWPCQSDQGDDHMDRQDNEVAHPGNSINTSIAAAFRLIWQFAMDRWCHRGCTIPSEPCIGD
jgi:hypothetical protein